MKKINQVKTAEILEKIAKTYKNFKKIKWLTLVPKIFKMH